MSNRLETRSESIQGTPSSTSPGGGLRPPPGEALDSASWILPERVSSRFETRFSGRVACIERCFYPHLYFTVVSLEYTRLEHLASSAPYKHRRVKGLRVVECALDDSEKMRAAFGGHLGGSLGQELVSKPR